MQIKTYHQAKEYLESFIKPYSLDKIKNADTAHNPLERIRYLLTLLGNPQEKFPSIVVSGTSGKGSTTYFISHILQKAGYKTGMAISPHLEKMNERIQINGEEIANKKFIWLLNEMMPAVEKMKQTQFGEPSYWEVLLAMGFLHFAKERVKIAVIEVGLEGRYDGTNILSPLVFVYTNTALDHTQILGETIEAIAQEGVEGIREKTPIVVTGITQPSVIQIFEKGCQTLPVSLFRMGKDFSYHLQKQTEAGIWFDFQFGDIQFNNIFISMRGDYQAENAALAIATCLNLKRFGYIVLERNIRNALGTAYFPGRFEIIHSAKRQPDDDKLLILDGAHNPAKMKAFIHALQRMYPDKQKVFLLGFKQSKDVAGMLDSILPVADKIVITPFHVVTDMAKNIAMSSIDIFGEIQNHPQKKDIPLFVTKSVLQGLEKTKKITSEGEIIVITGSLYLIGEVKAILSNLSDFS